MANAEARIEAIEIAFVELAKFLGRSNLIPVIQVATAIENEAKASKASAATVAAVAALARRLR